MNLKAAARRLGVHYQTAYRLVRSGELIAVKAAGTYEISEAALDLYMHRRTITAEQGGLPADTVRAEGAWADDDQLTRRLCVESGPTLQPLLDHVTARLAAQLGDGCVVRLRRGDTLSARSARHVDPCVQALFASILASGEDLPVGAHELAAAHGGMTMCDNFLRQDRAPLRLPRLFQQYEARLRQYDVMAVPVLNHGTPIGALSLSRSAPGRPYTREDVAIAKRFAAIVADGWRRHDRFQRGYRACTQVLDMLERHGATVVDRQDLAHAVGNLTDVGCAVFSADRQPLVANVPFSEIPVLTHPAGDEAWDRLESWGLDYLHDEVHDTDDHEREAELDWHWGVTRRPDFSVDHTVVTWTLGTVARQRELVGA